MSQHTPTEWEAVEDISSGYPECRVIDAETGFAVTGDVVDPETGKPSLKNAQLIAAAPKMLEALKDMLSGWRYIRHDQHHKAIWVRALQKAESAIAQAEGRAE